MISDLPILQVTEDTTAERLNGSFMEVSYLLSSANDGEKQNRYVSMAIPLGTLYQALVKANSADDGENYTFDDRCEFRNGFIVSGSVSADATTMDISAGTVAMSTIQSQIASNNLVVSLEGMSLVRRHDSAPILSYGANGMEFDGKIDLGPSATVQTKSNDANPKSVVNIDYLSTYVSQMLENMDTLPFEIKQLDYIDDALSSRGWIRLNSNIWLSSSDYPWAYNHLVDEYRNSTTTSSDQFGNTTITYKLAADGHKIISSDAYAEAKRDIVYTNTGSFWYYTIDESSGRFRLPLTQVFFQARGYTDTLKPGRYIPPSLPLPPSHTHAFGASMNIKTSPDGSSIVTAGPTTSQLGNSQWESDSVYSGDTTTVQPPAVTVETYMRCK